MKRILLTAGTALTMALAGIAPASSASQPMPTGQPTTVQATQLPADRTAPDAVTGDGQLDPAGSITLYRSDCTVGWYWIQRNSTFACYMGPYDDQVVASGVERGWEAGGANVTGGKIESDCGPYWLIDKWCAVIFATT